MFKRKNHYSFRNGFSLLELIVAIAIMGIMTAVLLVNQNSNKKQTEVDSAARQVTAQLRSLQNEALNGKQISSTPVCDFNFDSKSGNTFYSISYRDCASPAHSQIGSAQDIELNSGRGNVIMNEVSVSFSSPWGKSSAFQVIFSSKDLSKTASVCVCSSGNIYDQKGNAACSC